MKLKNFYHINIEEKGAVERDIEGVEAIDLDSRGEARNVPQLWMGAIGLVKLYGVRLKWCSNLK